MIQITDSEIDHEAALVAVRDPNAGANLLFVGTTRQWTGDVETHELKYECYREMATRQMEKLEHEAMERWDLKKVCIIHRIGLVPVGESSLAVAVSSPHRVESFEAAQWLIDSLKKVVPVWKQETDSEGQATWVHPGDTKATEGTTL